MTTFGEWLMKKWIDSEDYQNKWLDELKSGGKQMKLNKKAIHIYILFDSDFRGFTDFFSRWEEERIC